MITEEDDRPSEYTDEELSKKFVEVKDQGNGEYKAKSFVMAASKFSEGISVFLKHEV